MLGKISCTGNSVLAGLAFCNACGSAPTGCGFNCGCIYLTDSAADTLGNDGGFDYYYIFIYGNIGYSSFITGSDSS